MTSQTWNKSNELPYCVCVYVCVCVCVCVPWWQQLYAHNTYKNAEMKM